MELESNNVGKRGPWSTSESSESDEDYLSNSDGNPVNYLLNIQHFSAFQVCGDFAKAFDAVGRNILIQKL